MSERMYEPMFVSVGGDQWVNVDHIVRVQPDATDLARRCVVTLSNGVILPVATPARDFLNRMTGVTWK